MGKTKAKPKKTPVKKRRWTLSDENKLKIPEWNASWERVILSTEPIDVEKTAQAVFDMCKAAKLPMPRIVRVASPMSDGQARLIAIDPSGFVSSLHGGRHD